MKSIGLFAGSFDPFTIGHQSIVERALRMFDEVVVAVGHNVGKTGFLPVSARLQQICSVFEHEPRVRVISYTSLTGILAAELGVTALVRGVRSSLDFQNELTVADANRALFGIETVLIPTMPQLAYVSSSLVRELVKFGHDVSHLVPGDLDLENVI